MGCFDWDPFVYLLGHDIDMVQQDVPAMLDAVFSIIDAGEASQQRIEIPPRLMSSSRVAVRLLNVTASAASGRYAHPVTRPLIQPPLRAARIAGRLCSPQAAAIRGQWLWRIS